MTPFLSQSLHQPDSYADPRCQALWVLFFFFQAEDGIRDHAQSRGLGDVYKRQGINAEYMGSPGGETATASPTLSFSGHGRLPFEWLDDTPRAGLLDADALAWSHARTTDSACAEFRLPGLRAYVARSTGLRLLGEPLSVEGCRGYELGRVGGHRAVDSLYRALPAELREHPPLHQIVALRHPDEPGIAILSAGGDGSLMLADTLSDGETITWAIRQPLAAEQDMRQSLNMAVSAGTKPDFALMFSCIGRGPLFYGDDDRDLLAFRDTFPDTPLLGAYGTGQIIPLGGQNRLFHNTVLTLLFESIHVQSLPRTSPPLLLRCLEEAHRPPAAGRRRGHGSRHRRPPSGIPGDAERCQCGRGKGMGAGRRRNEPLLAPPCTLR
eukprot:TRINITY_DN13467_c0_g1_i1.p1 TRINITY_DN13467_c0_g1~~TRINITY_DN13467_c0_g1_i1.p1  ORF type:complete len:381 (-),score=29.79 TRINITY_DN13467_c0_g1_i1:3-1145(-)